MRNAKGSSFQTFSYLGMQDRFKSQVLDQFIFARPPDIETFQTLKQLNFWNNYVLAYDILKL